MRLTPPTGRTFLLGFLALVAGIVLELGLLEAIGVGVPDRYAFWLTAGGGILLVIGVVFRRV